MGKPSQCNPCCDGGGGPTTPDIGDCDNVIGVAFLDENLGQDLDLFSQKLDLWAAAYPNRLLFVLDVRRSNGIVNYPPNFDSYDKSFSLRLEFNKVGGPTPLIEFIERDNGDTAIANSNDPWGRITTIATHYGGDVLTLFNNASEVSLFVEPYPGFNGDTISATLEKFQDDLELAGKTLVGSIPTFEDVICPFVTENCCDGGGDAASADALMDLCQRNNYCSPISVNFGLSPEKGLIREYCDGNSDPIYSTVCGTCLDEPEENRYQQIEYRAFSVNAIGQILDYVDINYKLEYYDNDSESWTELEDFGDQAPNVEQNVNVLDTNWPSTDCGHSWLTAGVNGCTTYTDTPVGSQDCVYREFSRRFRIKATTVGYGSITGFSSEFKLYEWRREEIVTGSGGWTLRWANEQTRADDFGSFSTTFQGGLINKTVFDRSFGIEAPDPNGGIAPSIVVFSSDKASPLNDFQQEIKEAGKVWIYIKGIENPNTMTLLDVLEGNEEYQWFGEEIAISDPKYSSDGSFYLAVTSRRPYGTPKVEVFRFNRTEFNFPSEPQQQKGYMIKTQTIEPPNFPYDGFPERYREIKFGDVISIDQRGRHMAISDSLAVIDGKSNAGAVFTWTTLPSFENASSTWSPLGWSPDENLDIDGYRFTGVNQNDYFGASTSIGFRSSTPSDQRTFSLLYIGIPGLVNQPAQNNKGLVRIRERIFGEGEYSNYNLLGGGLEIGLEYARFGISVSATRFGVLIGSTPTTDDGSAPKGGSVAYYYNTGTRSNDYYVPFAPNNEERRNQISPRLRYNEVNNNILDSTNFAADVSASDESFRIAIAADFWDGDQFGYPYLNRHGGVETRTYDGENWVDLGILPKKEDFPLDAPVPTNDIPYTNPFYGRSVQINRSGQWLLVLGRYSADSNGDMCGKVYLYEWVPE